jgi:hypothetical protein
MKASFRRRKKEARRGRKIVPAVSALLWKKMWITFE